MPFPVPFISVRAREVGGRARVRDQAAVRDISATAVSCQS